MKHDLDTALARLDDYVRGQLSEELAEAYEEELFARALVADAPELKLRGDFSATFREMAARGSIYLWLTERDLPRVLASGLRIVRFELDLKNPGVPDLSGEFDMLITRVPIDLSGIRRLDVEVCTPTGELLKRMPDVAFDPADGAVFACCEAELARVSASANAVTRVWAADEQGRRLVAELRSGDQERV